MSLPIYQGGRRIMKDSLPLTINLEAQLNNNSQINYKRTRGGKLMTSMIFMKGETNIYNTNKGGGIYEQQ